MIVRCYGLIFFLLFPTACGTGGQNEQNGRWKGDWERRESQDGAQLRITKINNDTLHFSLFATGGASFSQLEGIALIENNKATFLADADGRPAECEMIFSLSADNTIDISEGGSECGDAMYVWYAGEYEKGKSEQ